MKITKDMTIKEILKIKPEACKILMDYGLGCVNCELCSFETLEEGCRGHGLSDDEVDTILELLG